VSTHVISNPKTLDGKKDISFKTIIKAIGGKCTLLLAKDMGCSSLINQKKIVLHVPKVCKKFYLWDILLIMVYGVCLIIKFFVPNNQYTINGHNVHDVSIGLYIFSNHSISTLLIWLQP